jgi:hypothetical protein
MGNKYVHNGHIAPITANARDSKGVVLFTKTFMPEHTDVTTGRVVSTGYTVLTDEEYDALVKGSRTFVHYKDKLKLLVVSDDVPPSARTPQEALVDARRKEREAQEKVSALENEVDKLKAKLHDSEDGYKKLVSASTDLEKVAPILAKTAGLIESFEKAGKDAKAVEFTAAVKDLKAAVAAFKTEAEKKGAA